MTNSPHFSKEQIKDLIRKAEQFQPLLPVQPIPATFALKDEEEAKPSRFSKLFIPVTLLAFLCCAFYLYMQHNTNPFVAEEMPLSSKRMALMRTAPMSAHLIETSIKELAAERTEALENAGDKLHALLNENAKKPISEIETSYTRYMDIEAGYKEKISTSLESLWQQMSPKTRNDVELFDTFVREAHLEPYLTPELTEAIAKTPRLPTLKLDLQALHSFYAEK